MRTTNKQCTRQECTKFLKNYQIMYCSRKCYYKVRNYNLSSRKVKGIQNQNSLYRDILIKAYGSAQKAEEAIRRSQLITQYKGYQELESL